MCWFICLALENCDFLGGKIVGRVILLTAPPATGKTTAIQRIIDSLGAMNCDGFYTQEVINIEGQRTGFVCNTLSGMHSKLADISFESEVRVGQYGVDITGFEGVAINTLEESLRTKKILIVDELGPMQLVSEKFRKALSIVMDSEKTVVGTIFYSQHPAVDEIKKRKNVELIELTVENRDYIANEIVVKVKAEQESIFSL